MGQANLVVSGSAGEVEELVADKGYHENRLLARCGHWGVRTYVPERKQKKRRWEDKAPEYEKAFRANRRRVRSEKGRRLNRWRSERCERSFAHVCETGGGRRTWLRGLVDTQKVHLLRCVGYNLGLLLRKVHGLRKPRNWEEGRAGLFFVFLGVITTWAAMFAGSPIWAVLALSSLLLVILAGHMTDAVRRRLSGAGICPFF